MTDPGRAPAGLGEAYSAIARAIADSLPLEDVLVHVAAAARLLIPYEAMGIWHADSPDDAVRLTLGPGTPPSRAGDRVLRRIDHSARVWPAPGGGPVCVGDAPRELDRDFAGDRLVIAIGYRATLALPLGPDAREILWFAHREPGVYTPEHGRALQPIADLATLASEHAQLQRLTRIRRQRRDALEGVLRALARALDVQAVFSQISEAVRDVLPHDHLSVGLVQPDGGIRFHASSLGTTTQIADYHPTTDFGRESLTWEFYLVHEYAPRPGGVVRLQYWDPSTRRSETREFTPNPSLLRSYTERGIRSELRVPVWLQNERVGYLFFTARRARVYGEEDVELARRVADHVALAISHERLAAQAQRAHEAEQQATRLQERVDALVEELQVVTPHRAIGRSRRWRDVLAQATKVAETDTTVLITGESGTGKEVVARYIHRASRRAGAPFVALNCAALPEQLLESELFGYDRGAFTGAHAARAGRIEQAAGGLLFLDEVAEMSPAVQAKFLRVLQEREFQRLGGSRTIRADVRVVAATNREPRLAMERGRLREDLYYRLSVFEIVLPALRERPDDILVLAEAFLEDIGKSVGRPAAGLSRDARDKLMGHPWPGNVRELRNAIERAVILCEGGLITGEHLPIALAGGTPAAAVATAATPAPDERPSLEAMEKEMIQKAMAQANNNKSEAARLLGLARGQLYSRLKRYGLTRAKR
ncbi:MAG TPA: sigma 54-interacting transcriptional regulator [Methylomirabilota bacterium]|nr:sigma 54-interacting transcriptional regulator [Methylomirabilota bacterium]